MGGRGQMGMYDWKVNGNNGFGCQSIDGAIGCQARIR